MNLDVVRELLVRVLADLDAEVRIEVEPERDGLTQVVLPDGSLHSTRLEPDGEADALVAIADLLQNDVNFWLPGAWGEALPACPGHPHPMNALVLDGEAWWVCPHSGERLARIGEHRRRTRPGDAMG